MLVEIWENAPPAVSRATTLSLQLRCFMGMRHETFKMPQAACSAAVNVNFKCMTGANRRKSTHFFVVTPLSFAR